MVARLHEQDFDIGAGEGVGHLQRVAPRHVGVRHALDNPHRPGEGEGRAQDEPLAAVLDQPAGDRRRFVAVVRRLVVDAVALQVPAQGRRGVRHDQVFGEVRRRGDADQAGDPVRQGARRQHRDPAAHAGADQHQRPGGQGLDREDGVVRPLADRPVLEGAGGQAVAGIVEAQETPALAPAPGLEGERLAAFHVGAEAGQEDDRRRGRGRRRRPAALRAAIGDCCAVAGAR